jgi:hypothetical protein
VTACVADRAYGTVETYCTLIEQGVRPHMAPMQPAGHKSDGLFTTSQRGAKRPRRHPWLLRSSGRIYRRPRNRKPPT